MPGFRGSPRILNWWASFHIFHSCNILVYSTCHAGSVMDFLHCSLGELVWRTQVQTESQGFYFPCCSIPQRNFPNFGLEILALHSAKNHSDLNFSLFCSHSRFKVWLKHSQDVYLVIVFVFSRSMQLLLFKRYYNLSIKGEKYQLDLFKLLMS